MMVGPPEHYPAPPQPPPVNIYVNNRVPKSKWVAFWLALLFGPLGMFYSTPLGAIIMSVVWVFVVALCFVVIGLFLIPVAIFVDVMWAVLAYD